MDWLARMNEALAYVETNLDGEINYETLAKIACCSSHNFIKMFSFITDVSLSEYIRRRRLTLAALELQNSNIKVIDVAVKFGYDSPVSFARAFQQLHGVKPSGVRANGVKLKAYPRMSFHIQIKGGSEMDYRIETKEAFQIFGIERIVKEEETESVDLGDGVEVENIDELWENGEAAKLKADAGKLPAYVSEKLRKLHTVFEHRETAPGTFATMLFAFRGPESKAEGYTVADIPAHTWAIFTSDTRPIDEQDEALDDLTKRIYAEWFPSSNYEIASALEFELCGGDKESGFVEIWLPVRKKAQY